MKLTLSKLLASFRSVEKLNNNFDQIEQAIENTLSRDGSTPNAMQATLDMDGNRIVNVGTPVDPTDAVRLVDLGAGGGEPIDLSSYAKKDLTNIANPDFYAKGIASGLGTGGGGGGPVDWTDITNKPATFPPTTPIAQSSVTNLVADLSGKAATVHTHTSSQVTDLTENVQDIVGAMAVAGANMSISYDDVGGTLTFSSSAAGGGGPPIASITDYSGVGDNSTDNAVAFQAAELDADVQRIYLPEGTFYTTSAMSAVTKYYWGPGKIRFSSGETIAGGHYTNVQTSPTSGGTGTGPTGWFGGDNTHVNQSYINIGNIGSRKSLTTQYFDPAVIPESIWFYNRAGWSGCTAHLASSYGPGTTTVTVKGDTSGFTVGDVVGFTTATTVGSSNVTAIWNDTVTISSKTSTTITFSPALTTTYPVNAVVSHGPRTMNLHTYSYLRNYGGGDAYVHMARAQQNYVRLPSQIHWADTSTVGQYGGDVIFNTTGTYGTGWESYYADQNNDVACIGQVNTYVRSNDTAAFGGQWIGVLETSNGTKPADAGVVISGAWRVGLDLVRGDFSSNSQAAIQLKQSQRIYFNSSVNNSGRGSVSGSPYGILYGNQVGNSYMVYDSDGSGAFIDTYCGGSYRTRLRANGTFSFNGVINAASDLNAGQDVVATRDVAAVGKLRVGMLNSPVYLYWDGSNLRATKDGGASSVVII